MKIIKIMQRNKIWIPVNTDDYEIKEVELKKNRPFLHLIYKEDITFKIIYICDKCGKEIETGWKKFVIQHINKNQYLCQKCTAGTKENREKISRNTKIAMNTDTVRNNHSKAQTERWSREEERIKRSKISKEIIEREGMREYIGKRTKEEMSKLDTKALCNPHKYMSEDEKKAFYTRIGKKISANYNELTRQKNIISRKNSLNNNSDKQERYIQATRERLLKKKSSIQVLVEDHIKNNYSITFEPEYPINLYYLRGEYEFMLLDLGNSEKKIAIEILGDFFHRGFIKYFFNNKAEEELKERHKNNKFFIEKFNKDLFRHNYLTSNGWNVLYVTESQIKNNTWIKVIDDFLRRF